MEMSNHREELIQEQLLRENVRKIIRRVKAKRHQVLQEQKKEEDTLRQIVRGYILQERAEVSSDVPSRSTGINVLRDVLGKIIKTLKDDYKQLTTDTEQRKSFRAHIINAVKNTLTPIEVNLDAADGEDSVDALEELLTHLNEQDFELDIEEDELPPEDAFIDVEGEGETGEPEVDGEEQERREFASGMEDAGHDITGRNRAHRSFKEVENQIKSAYNELGDERDRKKFYDYMITNLKMHFDIAEDAMLATVEEPTTPEYEDAQSDMGMSPEEEDMAGFGDEEAAMPPEEEATF